MRGVPHGQVCFFEASDDCGGGASPFVGDLPGGEAVAVVGVHVRGCCWSAFGVCPPGTVLAPYRYPEFLEVSGYLAWGEVPVVGHLLHGHAGAVVEVHAGGDP